MTSPTTQRNRHVHPILVLLGFFVLCYAVAIIGAFFTASSIPTWYAALNKPSFNPPNWIFAPVWTTLYGLMAIAAWLVWRTPRSQSRRSGLTFFAIQLILNALWTPVFFYLHRTLPALILILALWIVILLTARRFWKVDRFAAGLMIPYLLWIAFASALNYEIYRLN